MKIRYLYLASVVFPALIMCHEGKGSKTENLKLPVRKIVRYCYVAVDQKDSAFLNLITYGKAKLKGNLVIRHSGRPMNTGHFFGEVKGDTLFLTYHFYKGMDSSKRYTNPLALLKTQDTLILGTGHILHKLGRSYFDKNVPVNFRKGRFHFGIVECN